MERQLKSTEADTRDRRLRRGIVVALLLLLIAGHGAYFFYLSPGLSRAFSHVPDGVEYTLAMRNLLDGHGYTLRLNGADYPSRYQPWFSLLFVAPALLFAGGNVLCAWFGCFAAGVVAIGAAFELGRRLGGVWCGLLLAAVLGVFADFARFASVVMTEVPYTMLVVFAAVRWLKLCGRPETRTSDYLWFGLWCALAGALRSTGLVLSGIVLLPLLKRRPGRVAAAKALAAAWLPSLAVAAANLVYNKLVFGEFLRSGYHYWEPLPYDYPELTFGWKIFVDNLSAYATRLNLWFLLIPALVFAALRILGRPAPEAAKKLDAYALFVAAVAGITAAVYLPYFSVQERFFLPVRVLLLLGAAAAAAVAVASNFRRWAPAVLVAAALVLTFAPWPDPGAEQHPHDRLRSAKIATLCRIRETLPENAVLLTVFPQGAAEYFFAGRSVRRIIPMYRCYEYAQMVTAPRRVPPPPEGFSAIEDQRSRQYIADHGGARPYPLVFSEAPERIDALISSGTPVYVTSYTPMVSTYAYRVLSKRYRGVPAPRGDAPFAVFRLLPLDK